jgi:hypothetical protein
LGGHIIDFDHSKIAFEKGEVVKLREGLCVEDIANNLLDTEYAAESYVFQLKRLWKIEDQQATPTDFHWPAVGENDLDRSWC